MARFDAIFKNATLVNHDGIEKADIGVSAGRVAALGLPAGAEAAKVIDCTGLHILPGVIDTQVHFREPGLDHKEDLASGSLSAVMGGVTGVFEMPNTNPLTTSREAFEDKIARASGRMHCDFAFFIGGTHENTADLPALEKLPGCAGVKVFMGSSTGSLLVADDDGVEAILNAISRRAAFHSEDEYRLEARKDLRVAGDPSSASGLARSRSGSDVDKAAGGVGRKDRQAHPCPAHFDRRGNGVSGRTQRRRSAEVTPHHLTLDETAYARLGTYAQMNPPVRDAAHREGLWKGVEQGVADVLGSDHAPHLRAEKDKPYPQSPSGMTGVQTLVPVMLDHVNSGRMSLTRFVDMTSAGPQRLFNIAARAASRSATMPISPLSI